MIKGIRIAVWASFLTISMNFQIFRETQDAGPGPLLSTYIFLFSFFLILWNLTLYPKSLRQLGYISQFFVEFLIATFLTECIMTDFWFPLEKVVMDIPPKLAEVIDDMLSSGDWRCENICDALRSETIFYVASYFVSMSFLIAVLHATRLIDLRALREGPSCFFGDIVYRIKKFNKKLTRSLGFGGKHAELASNVNIDCMDQNSTFRKPKRTTRRRRPSSRTPCGKRRKEKFREQSRSTSRSSCFLLGKETEENMPLYKKLGCNII